MSDRQKGLLEAFERVVPSAMIRYCVRHVWANFKLQWCGQGYKETFWRAARAGTKVEFDGHMAAMRMLNKDAFHYLASIPTKHWCRHAFSTKLKCDMLLNNICECFNRVLKACRDKPIITLMEWIRRYVMKRNYSKKEGMEGFEGNTLPYVSKCLEWSRKEANNCFPNQAGVDLFEVDHRNDQVVVNLKNRSCGCYKWDLTGIPCGHAYASIAMKRLEAEQFVDPVCSKEKYLAAYGEVINPMPGHKHWEHTSYPQPCPPQIRKLPGRPSKKNRRKEPGEGLDDSRVLRHKNPNMCHRCGELGHNTRTCKNSPQEPSTSPKCKGGRPHSRVVTQEQQPIQQPLVLNATDQQRKKRGRKPGNKIGPDRKVIRPQSTEEISLSQPLTQSQEPSQFQTLTQASVAYASPSKRRRIH